MVFERSLHFVAYCNLYWQLS